MGVNNEYIEVAVGGVSNRGSICKASDLGKYLKPDLELYRSLYRLDNSAIEHFEANKTIRSYNGTFELDRLTFDIDKGNNSRDKAMKDIRYFLHLLEDKGADPEIFRVFMLKYQICMASGQQRMFQRKLKELFIRNSGL